MIYLPKEGSITYHYIKGVIDAENKEKKAYVERIEQAVGFEVERLCGYQPNRSLIRKYEVTEVCLTEEQYNRIDKKVWKLKGKKDDYYLVSPNRRTKQGKAIYEVFQSFKPVSNFWKLHADLGVPKPESKSFSIPQLLFDGIHYYIFYDDSVRADKYNSDLEEITMGRYEDMVAEAEKMEGKGKER